ncbi:MAG: hypothetical protein R6V41_11945 [Desulfobacteraceae bacterium]
MMFASDDYALRKWINHEISWQRQQMIRCDLKRILMTVGYRSHDVTGSGICLGEALEGLRGPEASASLHEWKVTPDHLLPVNKGKTFL